MTAILKIGIRIPLGIFKRFKQDGMIKKKSLLQDIIGQIYHIIGK